MSGIAKVLVVAEEVSEKAYAEKLSKCFCPILPFPCVFQVVHDNICAFELTRLQFFDVIIHFAGSKNTFTFELLGTILEQVDGCSPPFIILHEENEDASHEEAPNRVFVTSAADGEMPVLEVCQAIVKCLSFVPASLDAKVSNFLSICDHEDDNQGSSAAIGSSAASPATDCEGLSSCGGVSPANGEEFLNHEVGRKTSSQVPENGFWKPAPLSKNNSSGTGEVVTLSL